MPKKKKQTLPTKRKNYFRTLMRDLGYDDEFVIRVDNCNSEHECEKLLEYARISSIVAELKK